MSTDRTMSTAGRERDDIDEVTNAVLTASRALMGVAVRSIAIVEDDLTIVQYRALVLLTTRGEQTPSGLAHALGVRPSTGTRLCDRLVAKGFVGRAPSRENRRQITLTVTPAGRALARAVTARRRREIVRIVERLPNAERERLRVALGKFADAAGDIALPDDAWKLGWAP